MSAAPVAVVGAGVVGCFAAREILARSPGTAVTLLDRDAAGSGASRRSAGLHLPRGAGERVRRMSAESEDALEKLAPGLPPGVLFPLRALLVAAAGQEPLLREVYLDRAELRAVTPDAVPMPEIVLQEGDGVWSLQGCHYANVAALTEHLAGALRAQQATVREGVRVTSVDPDDDGVDVQLGTGETLRTERVVLAPGPWIHDPAWRELVAPLGLRVKRIVALHVDRRPADADPAVVFHEEDAFLLPLRHRGHFLFSYTCNEWDVDPDGPVDGLNAGHLEEARACLARHAPSLAAVSRAGRVFYDAYSPDREPRVEALDGAGRIVFAGAANGSGYRLAPAIAAAAATLAVPVAESRSR